MNTIKIVLPPAEGYPRVIVGGFLRLARTDYVIGREAAIEINEILTELEKDPLLLEAVTAPDINVSLYRGSNTGPVSKVLVHDVLLALDVAVPISTPA